MQKNSPDAKIPFIEKISDWEGHGVLSILGSTGSGKTSTALDWVRTKFSNDLKFPLLVSVDTVALYKGFDIGSAKVIGSNRSDFDWIGIDLFAGTDKVAVSDFVDAVKDKIITALHSNRPVICVGGSHFYERALIEGQSLGQASDLEFQESLKKYKDSELSERLYKLDARFQTIAHPNDRYRLCRYLDLAELQKISFEQLMSEKIGGLVQEHSQISITRLALGLNALNSEYEHGLALRIHEMFKLGWIEEVKTLLSNGIPSSAPAFQSVGYREIIDFLESKISAKELPEEILISHRQLAKKQRTWIRGMMRRSTNGNSFD